MRLSKKLAPMPNIRIDQLLPNLSQHDAIGTHAQTLQKLLRARGYQSEIFCEQLNGYSTAIARPVSDFKIISSKDDIAIFHFSLGSDLGDLLATLPAKIVVDYHNITPPEFFTDADDFHPYQACLRGRIQLPGVAKSAKHCWADSEYNAAEIGAAGASSTTVLPIAREYDALRHLPIIDGLASFMRDGTKNLLFVGRVVANKAQHDLLAALKRYKIYSQSPVRLLIAGSLNKSYFKKLWRLCHDLRLRPGMADPNHWEKDAEVVFLPSLDDRGLATVYASAHAFLCMSDHEGFCVPLVEAMHFEIPIVAHQAAAVPETLGKGGLLIDKRDSASTLQALEQALTDGPKRDALRLAAKRRATDFAPEVFEKRFSDVLAQTLDILSH